MACMTSLVKMCVWRVGDLVFFIFKTFDDFFFKKIMICLVTF
jgi:hypothetical protein